MITSTRLSIAAVLFWIAAAVAAPRHAQPRIAGGVELRLGLLGDAVDQGRTSRAS